MEIPSQFEPAIFFKKNDTNYKRVCYNESMEQKELEKAHSHSINNKTEILSSKVCGCFYCREMFVPTEIKNWVNDAKQPTAQCPYCFIDSVIGDASGIKITKAFLEEMHNKWFGK